MCEVEHEHLSKTNYLLMMMSSCFYSHKTHLYYDERGLGQKKVLFTFTKNCFLLINSFAQK